MGCGDNYNPAYGQYYACTDGYNYNYGECCDQGTALWISLLIWISSFLLCCLLFSLLFAGVRRRRRRMYRGRLVSTDTFDSYYSEVDRQEPQRVIVINGQNPNANQYASAYPPLPHGMRPLVDTSKPRTTIRIQLHSGQNTTLELNMNHTVADIHTYVMSVAPTAGSYLLLSGYPPRPLADPSMTIRAAKLENATIVMRIV